MRGVLFMLLLAVAAGPLGAVEANPQLKIPQGVRSSGMGSAYSMVRGSAESAWYNPAGLAGLRGFEMTVSHLEWLMGTQDEYLALGFGGGNWGVGLYSSLLRATDTRRDSYGNEQGEFYDSFMTGGAALGMRWGEMGFGLGVKGLLESVDYSSDAGVAFDFGTQARLMQGRVLLGGAFQNFGSSGTTTTGDLSRAPRTARLGLGWNAASWLLLAEELRYLPESRETASATGLELNWRPGIGAFALRAGYDTAHMPLGFPAGLVAGLGMGFQMLRFDYSYAMYGALGTTHRVALTLILGQREPVLGRQDAWQPEQAAPAPRQRLDAYGRPLVPPAVPEGAPAAVTVSAAPARLLPPSPDEQPEAKAPAAQANGKPDVQALLARARQATQDGDDAAAHAAYTTILRADSENAEVFRLRGRCLIRMGKRPEAMHDLGRAVSLNPSDREAQDLLKTLQAAP